jgi:hypothetical protein
MIRLYDSVSRPAARVHILPHTYMPWKKNWRTHPHPCIQPARGQTGTFCKVTARAARCLIPSSARLSPSRCRTKPCPLFACDPAMIQVAHRVFIIGPTRECVGYAPSDLARKCSRTGCQQKHGVPCQLAVAGHQLHHLLPQRLPQPSSTSAFAPEKSFATQRKIYL